MPPFRQRLDLVEIVQHPLVRQAICGIKDRFERWLDDHRTRGRQMFTVDIKGRIATRDGARMKAMALKDGSFQKEDIETLEFMPNGQLHFGLYDAAGNLKTAATPELTKAGKPSKCLWCHEINLNPPFFNKTDLPGYYSTQEFKDLVARQMRLVSGYRLALKAKVDFGKTQDHTNAENLYLSFAQPTVERLAAEWNIPVDNVKSLLRAKNLKAHPHSVEADDGILGAFELRAGSPAMSLPRAPVPPVFGCLKSAEAYIASACCCA
jgi:hypothetical protein